MTLNTEIGTVAYYIVSNIGVVSPTFEEVNILMTPVAKCGIFLERVTHKPCTLSEHHLPIHTLLITQ